MKIRGIVTTTALILAIIAVSTTTAAALSCSSDCDICVNQSGWWRDDGSFNASTTPIQAAVDNATAGDAICVAAGNYNENVDVDKRLTLRGAGAGVVTVTAVNSSDHVFEVTVDYVNISGFNVSGATSYRKAGIYLGSNVDYCNISENTASNNGRGIYLYSFSNDNTLTSNNCSNNWRGIYLNHFSNDNTLTSNNCSNNDHGIHLYSFSNDNTLTGNTASSNNYVGIYLYYSSSNTLTSNTASSNNNDGICLYDSNNNTLSSNNCSNNNDRGIFLYSSSSNTLASNTMSGNAYNFGVSGSSLSEYTQNIDTSNTVDGKPIYYWVDQKDRQIPSDAGFVGVVNGTNITVKDLTLTNNSHGVLFIYTEDSRIENVTADSNYDDGICLHKSSNNTLVNNTADSNNGDGICLDESSNYNTLANNTASSNGDGIYLESSSDNTLTSNTASSNNYCGIYLDASSNNLVNNTANSNGDGIYLYNSSDNTLTSNTASSNNYVGIDLYYSSNYNTLVNNTADSNNWYGIWLDASSNNLLVNNTANSNGDGIYLESSSDNTLTSNTASSNNWYGIWLDASSNNMLTSNTASSNDDGGIWLDASSNNMLANNTASNNNDGIYLYDSSDNTLTNNTASNNDYGIDLESSSNNNLIYNNYFDNTNNSYDDGHNTWNTTPTTGTNIIGGSWLGGNYWSDYMGVDNTLDGLGDTLLPYNSGISNGGDFHPLTTPDGVPPPNITSFAPPSPVNDMVCHWRTFNVIVNQTVNVSWYLNGSHLHANVSVTEANYTLHAEVAGEHNVSAIATNANGSDRQTWIWNVAEAPAEIPPTPTAVKPNGGENLPGGSVYDIKWVVAKGTHDLAANPITIRYSTNNGGSWTQIATNEPNDGRYSWNVPDPTAISTDCLVKVVAKDAEGNTGEDTSDATFTVTKTTSTAASTTSTGAPKDAYRVHQNVYAAGSGFAPGTNVDIHVVLDQDWNDGDPIPQDVTGAVETVSVNGGNIAPVLVWHAPLTPGRYDIVIDANRNGFYNASTDGLDSGSPGFIVVANPPPTPPTDVPTLTPHGIIALVGLLCVIGVSRIRRGFN